MACRMTEAVAAAVAVEVRDHEVELVSFHTALHSPIDITVKILQAFQLHSITASQHYRRCLS
jgi:hypothetical protein